MRIVWVALGPDGDPGDEQARLFGPYRAVVGQKGDPAHGRWAWAVYRDGAPGEPVAQGFGYDDADAKEAVLDWARPRAPRTLARRLRALRHRLD